MTAPEQRWTAAVDGSGTGGEKQQRHQLGHSLVENLGG